MSATFKVSDDVRAVLGASEVDATSVKLSGQLDRALYLAVDKVLKAAGGRWDRRLGKHVFATDPRVALGLAVQTGTAVNRQQMLQAFYTPPAVAARVARLAVLAPCHTVLEPSAGHGALLDAALDYIGKDSAVAYDVDVAAVEVLRGKGYHALVADFLAVEPHVLFSRVLMNPPFTKGQDVAHVTHALRFLAPRGRLVAITSPSWREGRTRAARSFRELLDEFDWVVEDVPRGAFRASGTDVATVILVVSRRA